MAYLIVAIAVLTLMVGCGTAQAQWWPPYGPSGPPPEHVDHKLTLGLFTESGVQGKLGPGNGPAGILTTGGYLELSHKRLRPALEVRGSFAPFGVQGTLLGPRVAWKVDNTVFYAGGLFGPNHFQQTSYDNITFQANVADHHGAIAEAVAGVEIFSAYHPNVGWKVEVTSARFFGYDQSFPLAGSVGFVLRVP